MPEIALVNPRRRRRHRRRRAAVRAARPVRRRRRTRARRRRPVVTALRRHSLYLTNPRRRRRYRRNPAVRGFDIQRFASQTLMPSAVGAAGALGVDLLLGFLPLPPALKAGPMRPVVRLAGAIGVGMLAGMIASRQTAEQVTAGAVTVVLYDTMKGLLTQMMPQLPLGQYDTPEAMGYVSPAVQVGEDAVSAYLSEGVSAYVPEGVAAYDETY